MTAHTCRPISKNSKTVSNCFSAMRLIRSIRRSVSKAVLLSLVRALVLSRVDYGNATLAGLPARQLCRLQSVFHAAARIVFSAQKFDHVTPLLQELHWLRVPERITFKLASLVFQCLIKRHSTSLPGRQHNSRGWRRHETESALAFELVNGGRWLAVPVTRRSTIGDRAFPVAATRAWNSLPSFVTSATSLSTFRRHLKTYLFATSY